MTNFEIKSRDGMARLGRISTKHGPATTPLLMPVVHPGKSEIKPAILKKDFGFQVVITNSYIIQSHERFREQALKEGVHSLLDFNGPIMTDSGTFQMYFHSLPENEIDPLEIVKFQREMGSDIGTILDAFSSPDVGRDKVEADVNLSLKRAKTSVGQKGDMFLAGTIQGGTYPELREKSAIEMAALDFDVHPIGGVVPLMERYRYSDVIRVTLAAKKHLPPNRPVHLFGCGHPVFLAIATLAGCDFFDSASYAKFAEDGRMMLPTGTVHLSNLRELPCECPICSSYSATELQGLDEPQKVIEVMKHNLYVTSSEMRRIRQAITEGKLFELAASRARSHPTLIEALRVLMLHEDLLERSEPMGKGSSILYTGVETTLHPSITRFHKRLIERYPFDKTKNLLLVPHGGNRPFAENIPTIVEYVKDKQPDNILLAFVSPIGIVPWELEHLYPAQQTVFPNVIDPESMMLISSRVRAFLDRIRFERLIWFDRDASTKGVLDTLGNKDTIVVKTASESIDCCKTADDRHIPWEFRKLQALFSVQWKIPAIPDLEEYRIEKSRSTGKIRHLSKNGEILFTLVPTVGLLAPTYTGGEELMKMRIDSEYKVVMDADSADYVRQGKSALAKFVLAADDNLRAGEEVLLIDESGNLLGVGKALLTGPEMLAFDRGVAVQVRHSKL